MKKRRLMKAAVLAMLLAMAGSGIQAAGVGNQKLGDGSRVTDEFDYQLAAGNLAATSANYAAVYGYMNSAGGAYSTALGSGLVTTEGNTFYNSATGTYSTAIGYANTATVGRSTAVGYRNDANIDYGTAVGVYNLSKGMYGTAVGYGDSATGNYSTAVGNKSSASGTFSTAIGAGEEGTTNSASGIYSSAFGFRNSAGSDYAQAFGTSNTASTLAAGAIVMGSENTADGQNANAFGYKNKASSDQTMAVGAENITVGTAATAMGYNNKTSAANTMALGVSNTASGAYAMATGQMNEAAGAYAFAEGTRNVSGKYNAVTQKTTLYTTAIGYGNEATGVTDVDEDTHGEYAGGSTVALGDSNKVIVNDSVALGQSNTITAGHESVAFGYKNTLNEQGSGIAAAFGGKNTVNSDSDDHPAAAFGSDNTTVGIAVGYHNTGVKTQAKDTDPVTDVYPVAIGSENEDSGIGSFNTGSGIGYQNTADPAYTTANAIGTQNSAIKKAAIAIGYKNEAGGDADKETKGGNSNAIGVLNVAAGTNSGAFGYRNYAGAENAIAMGAGNNMESYDNTKYTAVATGTGTVAVGYNNNAQTANSTVFGYLNKALIFDDREGMTETSSGENALFGSENTGYGKDAVALGYKNTTGKGSQSSTYGRPSTVTHHTVAIGNQNTATGTLSTNDTVDDGNTIAVGYGNQATANFAKAFGTSNEASGSYSTAFGHKNIVDGSKATALGVNNRGSSGNTTSIGFDNQITHYQSIVAGFSNKVNSTSYSNPQYYMSVFGKDNSTNNHTAYDTLVGFGNTRNGYGNYGWYEKSSLFGFSNTANNNNGSALGTSNTVTSDSIVMGYHNSGSSEGGFLGTNNTYYDHGRQYLIGGNNASNDQGLIIGYNNSFSRYNSTPYTTMIGVGNQWGSSYSANYRGNYSTFIGFNNGYKSNADIDYHNAIGLDNITLGEKTSAIGQGNNLTSSNSNAIGKNNVLSTSSSIAVGYSNTVGIRGGNGYSMAIGSENIAGSYTLYLYNTATSTGYATSVGAGNNTSSSYSSSFGANNVIAGTEGTIYNDSSTKYIADTNYSTQYSSTIGIGNRIRSSGAYSGSQDGQRSYAIGFNNITKNRASTALGAENIVGGSYTDSNYYESSYDYSNFNVAIGVGNEAGGTWYSADTNNFASYAGQYNSYYTLAGGFENKVTGYRNVALGYQNTVSGNETMDQGTYIVTESAAFGQSNIVKSAANRTDDKNTSHYAGGMSSYVIGHGNVSQAPYSTAIGAVNTVGGTQAYNYWSVGGQAENELDNTALGTGNRVGDGTFQLTYFGTDTVTRPHNTYAGTGIGFENKVGSNFVTAAGYGNEVFNGDRSTGTNDLGVYTVTYSAALGQNNIIRAIGETVTTGNDTYVMGGEYSYAIGYGNRTQFAGSAALGFGNTVGAATAARSVIDVVANAYFNANTAIGTGNTVGGLFVRDTDGKTYQVSYATGIGVSNEVYGEEATAVGVSNVIEASRLGHQDKNEKNRSSALGSRNRIENSIDTVGVTETIYGDVYNYALGNDNVVRGAGNLAVGRENTVGGASAKQQTADAANTAIGANNVVGGTYVDAEYGEANGRYNLAAGFGNFAIGQENTAIGIQNTIAENAGTLDDSTNSTQHNVLVGILNTVSNATYTAPRMYNVAIGEGNEMRNGYDTAIGFYNTVGGALATNVDNTETMYHVALGSQNKLIGTNGEANAAQMTAIGSGNTTYGRDSVAIGKRSVTGTEDQENDTRESAAIGVRAVASSMKSLAVGVDVTAETVTGAVAVGQNSTVSGNLSAAFGVNNTVTGEKALALGTDNEDVYGDQTIVVGSGNTSAVTTDDVTTGTESSVIFGVDSAVTGDRGVAFGVQDTAAGGAVAVGYHSQALGEHSLAMGYAQTVTETGAHATAVGSGYERTEGSEESQTTYYYGTTVSGVSGAAFGVANLVSGNYATAVGAGYYRHTEIDQTGVDYFFQNKAVGDYSAVFGYLNVAEGEHSLAAGTGFVETVDDVDTMYANTASGDRAAALGYANQALAKESLAAGGFSRTSADATGATAIGEGYVVDITDLSGTTTERRYNEATGVGATALGFANIASGQSSTAAGSLSKASAANATALGAGILKETKDGENITAVEYIENEATAEGATAIGYANSASGQWSTALGALSKAKGVGATAAGAGYTKNDGTLVYNEADGDGAIVYGYANIARGNNATAIGSTITVDSTEWVNQAVSAGSTAIGAGNTAGATDKETATAIGVTNVASGANAVAIGVSNAALADNSVFLGTENKTTTAGTYATAIGTENVLGNTYALAFGTKNEAVGAYSIAIATEAEATGEKSIAMGYQAQAQAQNSIAIGYQAQAQAANSIALGTNAQATFANSVAIGTNSVSTDSRRDLEKTLETAVTRTTYTVSFGNSTTTDNVTEGTVSRLTNVAEGRETKDTSGKLIAGVGDTDAINVKQLKKYINTVPVFYDHRDANASPFTAEGSYITTNDHWLSTDFWQDGVTHGKDSTAYGYLANAKGEQSSALGYGSTTDTAATDAIAMAGGTVTGAAGIAIGNGASAVTGAAIGTGATSTGSGYAIGTGATAAGEHQLTLGGGNTAGAEYTISVGNGTNDFRIVNLADAQTDKNAADYDGTAAVNVETMKKVLDTMTKSEAIVIYDDDEDGTDWRTTNNHWVATDFDLNDNDSLYTHGLDSTGYGYATKATGTNATAVGYGKSAVEMTAATANFASAFGTLDTASGLYALAAGVENTASGAYSAAVGYTSEAEGARSTALGYAAQAKGENSTAIGNNAIAYSKDSIAIGSAYDDISSGTMITQAAGEGATAIGMGALASGDRALSLGAYQNAAIGTDAVALGAVNAVYGDRSAAFGVQNAIGTAAASAAKSYALGILNTVTGVQATALGYRNTVSADYGTAAGFGSSVVGARGFAAGVNAAATQDAAAVGSFAAAGGVSSTAVGAQAYATAENSAAIGYQATAVDSRVADDGTDAKINTVSFGHKATDIDPLTISEANPSGTAYGTALTSRLTHIADGVSDTDAANVRQLKESVIVDFDATYASGGGKWLSTDFGYENKFTHGENSTAYGYRANAVGDASVALGYQAYTASENGVALGAESVATGAVVSVGHKKDDQYQYIDPDGNVATGTYEDALTRRITNVAKGTDDNDLVNVAQLKEETRTAGIVKWDGVAGAGAKHYLATYFGDKDYYTPGVNSSAYGYLTKATGEGSTAFGYAAWALADDGVALGAYSVANDNVISLGHAATDINPETNAEYGSELTRKIIHVADGTKGTDLVNVRTMKLTDPVKSGTTDGGTWLATSETATVSYTPGKFAAAYGSSSEATGTSSVAFGYGAKATAANSVALGEGSVADAANTVSVGKAAVVSEYGGIITPGVYRRIVNLEDGVADHDLITYAQLKAATVEGGIVDYDTKYAESGKHWLSTSFATAEEKPSLTRGEESVAFGYRAQVAVGADRGAALGYNASVTVADGVAIGADSVASVAGTVSVGHTTSDTNPLTGTNYTDDLTRIITGLAFGADDTDAVSVAQLKYTDPVKTGTTAGVATANHYLTTLDPTTYTPGENSVAYGLGTKGAWAPAKNAVAFGRNAYALAEGAVALGADSVAGEKNTVSLGHKTTDINRETGLFYTEELTRKITDVADAIWDENNEYYNGGTDLVNVAVLRAHTQDAPGIVRTIGEEHNLYTELNDSDKVNPASQAVAYGKQAYAKEANSVALGYKSYAGVEGGVALGSESVASEAGTVSVGHKAGDTYYDYDENGDYVVKEYEGALLRRVTGLAFGVDNSDAVSVAQLKLTDPVKTGTTDGVADTNHWLATPMGGATYARGENSVAYGYATAATAKNAVAFGYAALAQQENAVAIGADSVAKSKDTVSFGHREGDTKEDRSSYESDLERRIIHVADGVADTDLINVSQLMKQVDSIQVIDWDKDRTSSGKYWLSTDFGKEGVTHGQYSTAYGNYANAKNSLSAALGYAAVASADGSVALGQYSTASQVNTVSVGHTTNDTNPLTGENYTDNLTRRITNVATGTADTDLVNVAQLKLTDPVKTGTNTGVAEENHYLAMDFGNGILGTPGTNSAAYGYRTIAEGDNSVAIGYEAYAIAENSVALGAYSVASEAGTVSVGHKADDLDVGGIEFQKQLTRKIIHVADGILDTSATNYTGTDLVTVAQLRVAAATSGGVVEFNSDYDMANDHYLSTYIAEDGATNNATSAAYGYKANVAAAATNGAALGYGATVTAANATAIGAGSVASVANTISVGDADNNLTRRITNVANGITDTTDDHYNDGTDALTVGQLYTFYLPKSGTYEEGTDGNKWVATTFGRPIDPGENSTSYGAESAATGDRSTAFGYGAKATDDDSTALGAGSTSSGANTVSFGDAKTGLYRRVTNAETGTGPYDAVTLGYLEAAIRDKAGIVDYDFDYEKTGKHWLATSFLETEEEKEAQIERGEESVAFGYKSVAKGDYSTAFGYGAQAAYGNSMALGADSVVNEAYTISVGGEGAERRITNVAAGITDTTDPNYNGGTDAINVSQLEAVKNILAINGVKDSTSLKQDIKNVTEGTEAFVDDVKDFSEATAAKKDILDQNGITADSNISGRLTDVETKMDGLIGGDTTKEGTDSSIIGYGNTTKGDQSSAYGYKNEATGDQSTATGSQNVASGDQSSAYGSGNTAGDARDPTKTGQTAIGADNIVTGQDATGIGTSNVVSGEHATGNGYQNNVSGQDTIATGTQNHVEGTGSSAYGFDNHVTGDGALAYGSGNEARGDGALAIGSNAWATGDGGVAIGTGSRAVENSVAIGAGSVATEKGTVSFGNADDGTTSRLVNLQKGENNNDVATKAQLDTISSKADGFDSRINAISEDTYNTKFDQMEGLIGQTEKNISKVGAGAAAIAALHPLEFDPSEKVSFAIGYGNYQGESAMAIGAFVRPNESITLSLGGSMGNGDNLLNSSISFALGAGPSGLAARSKAALAKQVNEQDEKIAARDEEIARLRSLISQLEAMAETEEQKAMAHEMVVRSEAAELEELRSMAQQLVATASADQLRGIIYQLSPGGV